MADIYEDTDMASAHGDAWDEEALGPDVTPEDLYADSGSALELTGFQQDVVSWIQENQLLAVIGGFAVGVFLGVMLRD